MVDQAVIADPLIQQVSQSGICPAKGRTKGAELLLPLADIHRISQIDDFKNIQQNIAVIGGKDFPAPYAVALIQIPVELCAVHLRILRHV